jgi:uncharacterized Rmd1/YagE family protein
MTNLQFQAYAVTNEINLNQIAVNCGIPKKYTWEEPLILQYELLGSILGQHFTDDQKIMVFSFGSIVLVNIPEENIPVLLEYIRRFEPSVGSIDWKSFTDDFELRIGSSDAAEINDSFAVIPQFEIFYAELAAIVIAKSVAMESSEAQLEKILDKLEAMIDRLERGQLRVGDRELARTTARVARHSIILSTIS